MPFFDGLGDFGGDLSGGFVPPPESLAPQPVAWNDYPSSMLVTPDLANQALGDTQAQDWIKHQYPEFYKKFQHVLTPGFKFTDKTFTDDPAFAGYGDKDNEQFEKIAADVMAGKHKDFVPPKSEAASGLVDAPPQDVAKALQTTPTASTEQTPLPPQSSGQSALSASNVPTVANALSPGAYNAIASSNISGGTNQWKPYPTVDDGFGGQQQAFFPSTAKGSTPMQSSQSTQSQNYKPGQQYASLTPPTNPSPPQDIWTEPKNPQLPYSPEGPIYDDPNITDPGASAGTPNNRTMYLFPGIRGNGMDKGQYDTAQKFLPQGWDSLPEREANPTKLNAFEKYAIDRGYTPHIVQQEAPNAGMTPQQAQFARTNQIDLAKQHMQANNVKDVGLYGYSGGVPQANEMFAQLGKDRVSNLTNVGAYRPDPATAQNLQKILGSNYTNVPQHSMEMALQAAPPQPPTVPGARPDAANPRDFQSYNASLMDFNRSRGLRQQGSITIPAVGNLPERSFQFASGHPNANPNKPWGEGNQAGRGSVPAGIYPIGQPRMGTALGDTVPLQTMFDPKTGNNRTGILIHKSNANTIDRVASAGCLAIPSSQWFSDPNRNYIGARDQLLMYLNENKGNQLAIMINPDYSATFVPVAPQQRQMARR